MSINWTPWFNVPIQRRLELFSMVFMIFVTFGIPFIIYPVLLSLMVSLHRWNPNIWSPNLSCSKISKLALNVDRAHFSSDCWPSSLSEDQANCFFFLLFDIHRMLVNHFHHLISFEFDFSILETFTCGRSLCYIWRSFITTETLVIAADVALGKISIEMEIFMHSINTWTFCNFRVKWIRNLSIWKYCLNYYPLDMVKTADLSADKNYLVCFFPHGILR